SRNRFYENMREVAPGDTIFSFRGAAIAAIGVATSYGYESPIPAEFGAAGPNWERIGWRVDVMYRLPAPIIEARRHMDVLRQHLPPQYSPLQPDGRGLQGVYLTEISRTFAELLAGLVGAEARALVSTVTDFPSPSASQKGIDEWEEHIQQELTLDR